MILGDAASALDPFISWCTESYNVGNEGSILYHKFTQPFHKEKTVIEAYEIWYCDWFFRDKKELRDKLSTH